ncbi:hypothetical protein PG996_013714 [Apiospora saccharicola]|uniref:CCHC-type domain-containing protein n=1 Tax=Apiospora saccharicola TaxID=335842 RepID=A0ABR1U6A7_9PEZI
MADTPVEKESIIARIIANFRDAQKKRKRQDGEEDAEEDDDQETSLAPTPPISQLLAPRDEETRLPSGGGLLSPSNLRNLENRYSGLRESDNPLGPPAFFEIPELSGLIPGGTIWFRPDTPHADNQADRNFNRMRLRRALGPSSSRAPSRAPSSTRSTTSATTVNSAAPQQSMGPPAKKKTKRGGGNLCGNCGKIGHKVKNCAGPPAEDGFIHACPMHNSESHTLANCQEAKNLTLEAKYRHLVSTRHNLCPLYFNEAWEDIGIPLEKFDEYDYDAPDPACLGHEPETASVAAFKEWYRVAILVEDPGSDHDDDMDNQTEGSDNNGAEMLTHSRHPLDPNVDALL